MAKLPFQMKIAAVLAGAQAQEFAIGWANGLMRWKFRVRATCSISDSSFDPGSVKYAASEAAITFMRELEP